MPSWVFFSPLFSPSLQVHRCEEKICSPSFTVLSCSPSNAMNCGFLEWAAGSQMWRISGYHLSPQGSPGLGWLRAKRFGFKFSTSITQKYYYLPPKGDCVMRKSLAHGDAQEMLTSYFFPHLLLHIHIDHRHRPSVPKPLGPCELGEKF